MMGRRRLRTVLKENMITFLTWKMMGRLGLGIKKSKFIINMIISLQNKTNYVSPCSCMYLCSVKWTQKCPFEIPLSFNWVTFCQKFNIGEDETAMD